MKKSLALGRGNREYIELHTCRWCQQTYVATDPRQQYCPDTNHRVNYSKRRTRELEKLWCEIGIVFSGFRLTATQMSQSFERTRAFALAEALGFTYSDTRKRWELGNGKSESYAE